MAWFPVSMVAASGVNHGLARMPFQVSLRRWLFCPTCPGDSVSAKPTSTQTPTRTEAYTSARSDIAMLVPESARDILDVGCSNGSLGRALISLQPGRKVCGIELDKAFSLEAAQYLDEVINDDLNTLDWEAVLPGRSFDCMIFADVLEHLQEPGRSLKQALTRLRPGGSVVICLPNIRHVSALSSIFFSGTFPRRDRGIFDRTHLRWFTFRDACSLLNENGLQLVAFYQGMRWGDAGGGRVNRLLNRLPEAVKRWMPVREFFTYQFAFSARMPLVR